MSKKARKVSRSILRWLICASFAVITIRRSVFLFPLPKYQNPRVSISFDVEGGFTNQLLDLAYVTTLAISNKPCGLRLPELWSDGTQRNGINRFTSSRVPFSEVFDLRVFEHYLSQSGVELSFSENNATRICQSTCKRDLSAAECQLVIQNPPARACTTHHVHIQAPFLHRIWSTSFLLSSQHSFDQTLQHLQPSPAIRAEVERIRIHFTENSKKAGMLFVHARIEKDWHQHCLQWHPYRQDYMYNCYVGVEEIFSAFQTSKLLTVTSMSRMTSHRFCRL